MYITILNYINNKLIIMQRKLSNYILFLQRRQFRIIFKSVFNEDFDNVQDRINIKTQRFLEIMSLNEERRDKE